MSEVSTEPQAQTQAQTHVPRLTLNSDGQRHPVLNAFTVFTFIGGIAAFALGLIVSAHLPAAILGIVVFAVGMVTQMMSATREQRIFIIAGIIAGAVGAGLAIAHGGFG
ncbi:MAG TPA: hypothetical protein VMR00_12115 [Streptosporangiaceae bacterium]|jgi:hypothetical protein|nr:hypothetical protein [Streptosporangiaceae bacterium]